MSVVPASLSKVQKSGQPTRGAGREREPHVPVRRLKGGAWVFAPYGVMLPVDAGRRVVCHVCGDASAAVSAQHARRHGLTLTGHRERFGLNRKTSLLAPAL